MLKNKGVVLHALIVACALVTGWYAPSAMARHGEETYLTNRIPEPAPYEVSETTAAGYPMAPHNGQPFESLWTSLNDTGGCSGCHGGLYAQWNGSMMANAWRDPGWRGAFLLVARATSTDGCNDTTPVLTNGRAADNSKGNDCTLIPGTTMRYSLNPFANGDGTSTYHTVTPGAAGTPTTATYTGSGSLLDDFCSRCHMPTNYVDATTSVTADNPSGMEHGGMSPTFDPTAINPAATVTTTDPYTGALTRESFGDRLDGNRPVNSNSGKIGIICEVCHTNAASRYTPYHNYNKSATDYYAATKSVARTDSTQTDQFGNLLAPVDANGNPTAANHADMLYAPDATAKNLGYGIGAGSFRLSPHALNWPERFGNLSWYNWSAVMDAYITDVFAGGLKLDGTVISTTNPLYFVQAKPPGKHDTFYQVKFERAEFCGSCHDVTNPATIKNQFGKWVGGFPIERTYTEYLNSRYADRTGNMYYDPNYKRDCQSCHMQQSWGQAGTALTLYRVENGVVTPDIAPNDPAVNYAALSEPSCDRELRNPGYSHHFVGGNAYMTKLIGADVDGGGAAQPYPELLETSFSSYDKNSRFANARFDTTGTRRGTQQTQHERFAWDRLRNAVTLSLSAPASVSAGTNATLNIVVKNEGAGHNFPTGFPEGRAAWVAVRAYDTKNTASVADDVELNILDTVMNRTSMGVGYLTTADMLDPTYPSTCKWNIPQGSIDPYAVTFRAVASLDGTCPTLDLPYAAPLNIAVNANGVPKDAAGNPIDRNNPMGLPIYTDKDTDGDLFDDAYLSDTRLGPARKAGTTDIATKNLNGRYQVVVPAGTVGPVSVTTVVYYQSFEAIVAKKFLGNLANLDDVDADEGFLDANGDGLNDSANNYPKLEPCVLKGPCDRIGKAGATGETQIRQALLYDPVVVDGAPPVPAEVATTVINVTGTTDNVRPMVVINNSKATGQTNMQATIPANRHWSPSPYGGATGNYATEGIGEQNVNPSRIVKISFSEPVKGVNMNTFYLTDGRGRSVPALLDQIDDTTYALFPYTTADLAFLSGSVYVIHVAPSRNGSSITDFNNNLLTTGPATGGEYTFGFKIM